MLALFDVNWGGGLFLFFEVVPGWPVEGFAEGNGTCDLVFINILSNHQVVDKKGFFFWEEAAEEDEAVVVCRPAETSFVGKINGLS